MSAWLPAHDALRTDWDKADPRSSRLTEVTAKIRCRLCSERFFTDEGLELHLRAEHRQQPSSWPHGIRARYKAGCRCQRCRWANADYVARRRRAVS